MAYCKKCGAVVLSENMFYHVARCNGIKGDKAHKECIANLWNTGRGCMGANPGGNGGDCLWPACDCSTTSGLEKP